MNRAGSPATQRVLIPSTEKLYPSTTRALAEFGIVDVLESNRTHEDCTVLLAYPSRVKEDLLVKMKSLRGTQVQSAGVDGLNFASIPKGVRVYSKAGGFTGPVAEQAWTPVLWMARGCFRPVLSADNGPHTLNNGQNGWGEPGHSHAKKEV